MTIDLIPQLVNLGSAGAVIIVVIIFLRSNEKRDAEWRNFFTALNKANRDDLCTVVDKLENVVKTLDAHDAQAKRLLQIVEDIKKLVTPKTRVKGSAD